MNYPIEFPVAYGFYRPEVVIKQSPEDFIVEELFAPEFEGQGEHVWLWIQKTGQNTEYVAKQIAKYASVRDMDVGFSGLKDRWAVTKQWFSVYISNKSEPDWLRMGLEGVNIIRAERHNKKLRRGEHKGNRFCITLRNLADPVELLPGLEKIQQDGFPNYFGVQRFGLGGANLSRGHDYFEGKIKASRSQRSFYLSAARSFLFNQILAGAIRDSTWIADDAQGALFGDPQRDVDDIIASEQAIFDAYPVLIAGLHKNRMRLERRPLRVIPSEMGWQFGEHSVTLEFSLPSGVFATAMLDEIAMVTNASGVK